jgi:hypothetical protein
MATACNSRSRMFLLRTWISCLYIFLLFFSTGHSRNNLTAFVDVF